MNCNKIKISIIIPVFNEAVNIDKFLNQFNCDQEKEIIFVDGGSTDNTVNLIKKKGFQIINSAEKKRSYQMNLGAKNAQGNFLLFLHGDTFLPDNYLDSIEHILNQKDIIAGAFQLTINDPKIVFRLLEILINWRSNIFSLPYGDQGIFIKKSTFQEIKGFPNVPIMEDFMLIKMLQKKGIIKISKLSVITSARRWQKLGILKTTLINQMIILGYYLGFNLDKLANFYYQEKRSKK